MKNCLIVLGMHRSGTSAFTGILDLLGVNLGTKMLETQRDNPKGFFENKYVVLANDCILESLNSSWDDPLPLPPHWPERFDGSQLLTDARSFLRTDIANDQLSGLKDPRLCRLLPFWLPLFAEENITPHFALVIRNPLEIADSLYRRNGFPIEKSLVLWMQYMLEAERHSRHLPRGFIKFESVLTQPQKSIEKVFRNTGLEQPDFSNVRSEELNEFLDQNMRHHTISEADLDVRCHHTIAAYYRLLCKVCEGDAAAEDLEAFDHLSDLFALDEKLFYNDDIVLKLTRAKEVNTPAWYQEKLNRVRGQFDADKLFREYRYIANTEHLYQDRLSLNKKIADGKNDYSVLQNEISILQKEISTLQTELLTPHIKISNLRSEIAFRNNENSELRNKIEQITTEANALQSEICSQADQLSVLKNEISIQQQARITQQNAISSQKLVISAQKEELLSRDLMISTLQEKSEDLKQLITGIYATKGWRAYQKYRRVVERMFPALTPRRNALQDLGTTEAGTTQAAGHTEIETASQINQIEDSDALDGTVSTDSNTLQGDSTVEEERQGRDAAMLALATARRTDDIYPEEVKPETAEQNVDITLENKTTDSELATENTNLSTEPAEHETAEPTREIATSEESEDEPPLVTPENTLQRSNDHRPRHLEFPIVENPNVSIIIPVFNNWPFTFKCLRSLAQHTQGSYEIIIVDNNSTDETPQQLAQIEGINIITNPTNEVFVNACNQAADVAKGNYFLFLNNDTEVCAGWLDSLLAPFSDPATGIVGAKLIYPDGSLQEAGGIIWSDGNGCNYGHGDNPDLPQYSYRKSVDYCSGACLIIPRSLWHEVGGFDQRFAPAYYEDTDLCFTIRALGYHVIFQPLARVIHFGGASAGKETSSGYKRFQDINREKFIDKWRDVLQRDHVLSSSGEFKARERVCAKHILIIDHQLPMFDRDSGSLRMLNLLKILQKMDYKVSFWPDQLSYDPKYTRVLQDLGIETYYGEISFEAFIRAHGNHIDAVLMSRPVTTKKYMHLVKKYTKAKTIFDTVDLHYVREQRRLELEVQRWKSLEHFLAEEADTTLVVSPTEKEMLADEEFSHKIAVVSNIHTLEPCNKGFEERKGLMFIGSFAHPPNEEGIIWFIDYILPLIRKKIPDIHLTIVGSDATERLMEMQSKSITVTGYVEDVSEYFSNSKVFVSPLLHGAGVKGKIGQSFSYGLPVVTTGIGAEGMQLTDGLNVLVADSETDFANSVIALYNEKFLWQKLSTNCRQVIREQFSVDTIRAAMEKILETEPPQKPFKRSSARPVIVHCHLFKNAGTTLDWSLQRQFGTAFVDHRDDENMQRGAAYLKPYLETQRQLSAISSHHIRFPLPVSEKLELLPVISLRHPIDRARSVYEFERRQDATTPGAIHAKKLSFADYVRWRMQPEVSPAIRNFHCSFCTSNFDSVIDEQAYLDSVAMLIRTPLLVIVERYDESMILLEDRLNQYFPDIDLSYIRQNETFGREVNLVERIQQVFDDLGPELTVEFREKNHWDMKLYENALAILGERLGSLGNVEQLLGNIQARCQLLSVATLPGNELDIPEYQVE
jgi:GT2 family glycosyltransferase/predicted  nucleic acid-binding Zn-ribbon protein